MLKIKRAYETPAEDGYRVLVDRLWPRGIKKEAAQIDLWLKEVAPSNELRKWFNHDSSKFAEFKIRYQAELKQGLGKSAFEKLQEITKEYQLVTLVYGAKDTEFNQAVVLQELLT